MDLKAQLEIDQIISDLIDSVDIKIAPSPEGVGLKAHIGELISDKIDGDVIRIFIQFYVQSNIPINPQEQDLGYTSSDVEYESGVVIAEVTEVSDPPEYIGETISVDDFVNTFITTESTRGQIIRLMDKLEVDATPTESWLEHVTSLYNDRILGKSWFIRDKVLN